MIYERWFVTKDPTGTARFYYSEIFVRPFPDARMIDDSAYPLILQNRFRKLLKNNEIEVEVVKDSLVTGIAFLFNLKIGNIVVAKRCGNWVDLNEIREAIHLVSRYSIEKAQYAFDVERGLTLRVKTDGMPTFVLEVEEAPMRCEAVINQNLILKLCDAIAERWRKAGNIYEHRKCEGV